jgi:hypothetical protein
MYIAGVHNLPSQVMQGTNNSQPIAIYDAQFVTEPRPFSLEKATSFLRKYLRSKFNAGIIPAPGNFIFCALEWH